MKRSAGLNLWALCLVNGGLECVEEVARVYADRREVISTRNVFRENSDIKKEVYDEKAESEHSITLHKYTLQNGKTYYEIIQQTDYALNLSFLALAVLPWSALHEALRNMGIDAKPAIKMGLILPNSIWTDEEIETAKKNDEEAATAT